MNFDETLNYIHSLGNSGRPAGLERITKLLSALGNPQDSFRAVHIAGTNGKGSVSAMLSSVFRESGLKTGLFISPYITDFCERIQIGGVPIAKEDLIRLSSRVKGTGIDVGEFEFITAVGFLHFAENGCDIAVIETGLGGRMDATNTLKNVDVAVITKIGLDHTALLGDTIEKIAEEKCGIVHHFKTVSAPAGDEVKRVIQKHCKNAIFPDLTALKIKKSDLSGSTYIYKGKEYTISLPGIHQIENALVAAETVTAGGYHIEYDILYSALKKTTFPARLEVLQKSPPIVLDGAHNADGAAALAKFMKPYTGKITAIIGMMADKDFEQVCAVTLPLCKNAVAVTVPNLPRALSAEVLCRTAQKYCECSPAESIVAALALAKEKAGENPIFIFGSLYLASAVKIYFDN